jgi:hypothetical protein
MEDCTHDQEDGFARIAAIGRALLQIRSEWVLSIFGSISLNAKNCSGKAISMLKILDVSGVTGQLFGTQPMSSACRCMGHLTPTDRDMLA